MSSAAAAAAEMRRRNAARNADDKTHLELGVQVVGSLLDNLGSEAIGLDVGHHLKHKRHGGQECELKTQPDGGQGCALKRTDGRQGCELKRKDGRQGYGGVLART